MTGSTIADNLAITVAEWRQARDAALRELLPAAGFLATWYEVHQRAIKQVHQRAKRRHLHRTYRQRQVARRRRSRR